MKLFKALLILAIIAAAVVAVVLGIKQIEKLIYPLEYSEYVEQYSEQNKLDKYFVYAVIKCESSFNKDAVSSVGARGLMQLTPETFDWVNSKLGRGEQDASMLYDEKTNIECGTYLLRLHIDEFGNTDTALAAYHAGRGRVNGWLNDERYSNDGTTLIDIPYPETKSYVAKVAKTYEKYKKIYQEDRIS